MSIAWSSSDKYEEVLNDALNLSQENRDELVRLLRLNLREHKVNETVNSTEAETNKDASGTQGEDNS